MSTATRSLDHAEQVVVGGEEQHLVEPRGHGGVGDRRHRVVRLPALGAVAGPAHPARGDVGVAQLRDEVVRLLGLARLVAGVDVTAPRPGRALERERDVGGLLLADPGEHEAQERADQEHRPAVGREGRPAASREVGAVGDVGEVDDEEAAHGLIVASGP